MDLAQGTDVDADAPAVADHPVDPDPVRRLVEDQGRALEPFHAMPAPVAFLGDDDRSPPLPSGRAGHHRARLPGDHDRDAQRTDMDERLLEQGDEFGEGGWG